MSAEHGLRQGSAWQDYGWWQSRLAQEFFGEDRAGTPVLFYVDEPELLALRDGEDVKDLGVVVSSVLAWHDDPYAPVVERCRAWKRGEREDPPPSLPLLGAAVLAAANMRRTVPGPGAPGYYERLAEVLQPSWGGDQHEQRLRRYYEDVAFLWDDLDDWLREKAGAHGVSTIKKNPSRRLIGYAQSQALIRAYDHAALTRFFHAVGLTPNQPVDSARLLRDLAAWSDRHRQGLSRELLRALASDTDRPLLEPLLAALVEGWDGKISPGFVDGLRQVPLRLVLDDGFTGWELRWHADTVPGVERDVLKHPGGEFGLVSEAGDQAYALTGAVPDPADVLKFGLTARGARAAVRVESGRSFLALQEDPVAGGWTETDVLTVFEPYVFLVSPAGTDLIRSFLTAAGLRWYQPEEAPIPGWQLTPDLEFKDKSALTAALAHVGIRNLRYVAARRLGLRNGLHVRREWGGRSHYLAGGEPDVMVPEDLREPGSVTLDDCPLSVPAEGVASLRGMGLTPGRHVLAADGAELSFYLEELIPPQPVDPVPRSPEGSSAAVAVPLSGDARFLTAQGRYLHIPRPQEPQWWQERAPGLCGGGTARVPIPPTAVWLVVIPESGVPSVTLLRHEEPEIGVLSRAAKDFWSQIMLLDQAGRPHAALWRRYRQAVFSRSQQVRFGHV
ncbi:hypothetical protein ACFU3E_02875 [Streptomyces sp. NPDC057424]|uniref:hypothetical protein n=1 Tax=Streptomyces sp. NPDC057424 TaxID=3346127 RepID=UPI00369AB1BF